MTTKELIQKEINNLSEEELKELYQIVRDFTHSRSQVYKPSFMSRLRNIKIDAPDDFATNFDLYLSGEKRVR